MTRISIYALLPFIIIPFSFNTVYFDVVLMTSLIVLIANLIRRKHLGKTVVLLFFTILSVLLCSNKFSLCNKSFYKLIDKPVTLTVTIDETPTYDTNKIQATARLISAVSKGEKFDLNGRIMVFIKGNDTDISYGDSISFKTIMNLPADNMNDGGFSYENYLRSQDVHLVCNTSDFSVINNGTAEDVSPILVSIFKLRDSLLKKCGMYFGGDTLSFLKALLLGDTSCMTDELKTNFSRSGISHVVAVSGMHLSIFMVILNLFLQRRNFKGSNFIIPLINILMALFLTAITGFSPSMKRAAIMLIISNCIFMAYREIDTLQSLGYALLILLLDNPFAISDPSLSLSATAVLGIIFFSEKLNEKFKWIKPDFLREIVVFSISAQITTFPVCVYYFNTISVLSIVTNLLTLPFVPYIMGVGILFLAIPIPFIARFISGGLWLGANIIIYFSRFIASLRFSQIQVGFLRFIFVLVLISLIVYLMRKTITCRKPYKNVLYLLASTVALMMIFITPHSNSFTITAINVGQGDCTLIDFPYGKTMLIDGGGEYTSENSSADIIKPYILNRGIEKIDYALISHYHTDHIKGILDLAENFKIGCIIAPDYFNEESLHSVKQMLNICKEKNIPLYFANKGDEFSPDKNSRVVILNPDSNYTYNTDECSIVAKITCYGKSLLTTGDIDYYTKSMLLETGADIKADILKAPHHGDYAPLDEEFIHAVSPDDIYICVGENNTYGHPKQETVSLLEKNNINISRTDIDGTIIYKFKKGSENP